MKNLLLLLTTSIVFALGCKDNTIPDLPPDAKLSETNVHYQAMRDLLLDNLPPNTDVITNVEVGYYSYNIGHIVRDHHMQGWYGDIVQLEIGKEEPESLPFP